MDRKIIWTSLILSVLLILVYIFTDYSGLIRKSSLNMVGDVVDIYGTTDPIYYYIIGDNEYACNSKSNLTKKHDNSPKVYYDNNNPIECMTSYDLILTWYDYMTISLMVILFVISLITLKKYSNKKRNKR